MNIKKKTVLTICIGLLLVIAYISFKTYTSEGVIGTGINYVRRKIDIYKEIRGVYPASPLMLEREGLARGILIREKSHPVYVITTPFGFGSYYHIFFRYEYNDPTNPPVLVHISQEKSWGRDLPRSKE